MQFYRQNIFELNITVVSCTILMVVPTSNTITTKIEKKVSSLNTIRYPFVIEVFTRLS